MVIDDNLYYYLDGVGNMMNLVPAIKFLLIKSYLLKNIPFRNKVIDWTWELGKRLLYVIITYSKAVAISVSIYISKGWNSGQNSWRFYWKHLLKVLHGFQPYMSTFSVPDWY